MRPLPRAARALAVVAALGLAAAACSSSDDGADRPAVPDVATPVSLEGTLTDGARWSIQVPDGWNGTLVVYSHGYTPPDSTSPLQVAPSTASAGRLLQDGYALAGTTFGATGWVVEDAVAEQLELLDVFADRVATPPTTLAWGSSMGGLITTALLEQHPDRFDGGAALCGPLGGGVAFWDVVLDTSYLLRALVLPDPAAQLVDITTDQRAPFARLQTALVAATQTPIGRARLALIAALTGEPPSSGATADVTRQATDLATMAKITGASRAELERRFGGNPSTNAGVDYAQVLAASPDADLVRRAYADAGADATTDLAHLATLPRVPADAPARAALARAYDPTARLDDPLLTLHTTEDPYASVAHERVYADRAKAAGTTDLLRQTTVDRVGHCTFTPGEEVAALEALHARVERGRWPDTRPQAMQDAAREVDDALGSRQGPAFVEPDLPVDARLAISLNT